MDKDHNKAFALSKKISKNLLGYCYHVGIGTDINVPKAFKLYQKATDLMECITWDIFITMEL